MVRVTDARMSGTSFGTVLLHVAPEAAVGGPLGLVRDGDMISVDVAGRHARPRGRRRPSWPAARPRSPRRRPGTCGAGPPCTRSTSCRRPTAAILTSSGRRRRRTGHSSNPSLGAPEGDPAQTQKGESREAMENGSSRGWWQRCLPQAAVAAAAGAEAVGLAGRSRSRSGTTTAPSRTRRR